MNSAQIESHPLRVTGNGWPVETAQSPKEPPPKGKENSESVDRYIDLNRIPPDGTEQILHQALMTVATKVRATVHLGLISGERILQCISSNRDCLKPSSRREIESAVREASKATHQLWSAMEGKQTSVLLQQIRTRQKAELVLGLGISDDSLRCGIILVFDSKNQIPTDCAQAISRLRSELSDWIKIWYRCSRTRGLQRWLDLFSGALRSRRNWLMAIAFGTACLAVPVPYWPKREAVLEPASRRFVASPVAGRVVDASVRPGDTVVAGQMLARIDDEKLLWELNESEAEYRQALKKRDAALAAGAAGDLRAAQLDIQRIAVKRDLLQSQLSQLDIVSPISGVVVSGDWVPTAGSSVERSDMLFEIAPLDRMLVRVMLTTEDLGNISLETPITLRTEAAYGRRWQGEIGRIDPRGEVENGRVRFLAETEIDNELSILRPGMKGSVRITAGYRSLGWMIFHRPYVWMMNSLAW